MAWGLTGQKAFLDVCGEVHAQHLPAKGVAKISSGRKYE